MQLRILFIFVTLLFVATSCSTARHHVERPAFRAKQTAPVIVIDAGHGGKDDGTQSRSKPKVLEKHLNLETALLLEELLQSFGYQTILTRGDDTFVPLKVRSSIANGNRATLFVSVHYNAAENVKAEGVEVYYYDSEDHRSHESSLLAHAVLKNFLRNTGSKSRGVKQGNYAVIRETEMPAILVESGFLSNETELKKIMSPGFFEAVAESIAQGIHEYFN